MRSRDAIQLTAAPAAALVLLMVGATTNAWRSHRPFIDASRGLWRVIRAGASGAPVAVRTHPLQIGEARSILTTVVVPSGIDARTPASAAAWLGHGVPPGRYALDDVPPTRSAEPCVFSIGRPPVPFLRATPGPGAPLEIDLPAGATELSVRLGRKSFTPLSMRVVSVSAQPRGARLAVQAMCYGEVCAWLSDESTRFEPTGFWAIGRGVTSIVFSTSRASRIMLRLRNGPAANRVSLEAGPVADPVSHQHIEMSMAAREERAIGLPERGPHQAIRLSIRSESGFRPADMDPHSRDTRVLGVWIMPIPDQ
jgi:hypothetical protein